MKLEKAASQLEALGNPTRLQLYRTLVRAGAEGLPVGRVQEKLGIAALHALASPQAAGRHRSGDTGAASDHADLPCPLPHAWIR